MIEQVYFLINTKVVFALIFLVKLLCGVVNERYSGKSCVISKHKQIQKVYLMLW